MHHFYGNPLSVFFSLLGLDQASMTEKLKKWNTNGLFVEDHATGIRMLRSFREYIESLVEEEPSKALRLLEDDVYLITEVVPELLCDITTYQQEFKLGIHLLELLQSQFPKIPGMNKSKRVLFLEALEAHEGDQAQSRLIRLITNLLRKIKTEHISKLLADMRKLVNQEEYKDVNEELLHSLTQWQERCDHHLKADAEYLAEMAKREKQLEGIILPGISTERRHTETAKKSESDSVELLKERGNEISKLAIDIADLCNENLW
jgi:origin recognition complex subunit 3